MTFRASNRMRVLGGVLLATLVGCAQAEEKAVVIPAPAFDEMPSGAATATATFAGGCFWGVQGVFQRVQGVLKAVSGYAGGKQETAHYEMVGSGTTGHAETVQITYDPSKVPYAGRSIGRRSFPPTRSSARSRRSTSRSSTRRTCSPRRSSRRSRTARR